MKHIYCSRVHGRIRDHSDPKLRIEWRSCAVPTTAPRLKHLVSSDGTPDPLGCACAMARIVLFKIDESDPSDLPLAIQALIR